MAASIQFGAWKAEDAYPLLREDELHALLASALTPTPRQIWESARAISPADPEQRVQREYQFDRRAVVGIMRYC